jgi:hypothetical protein
MEVPGRPSISELRDRLGTMGRGNEDRQFLACKNVRTGVPRGVLCEITGSARTAWVLDLLVCNPSLVTFWVEDKITILPTAFHQRGVDLSRVLIAEAGEKLFQTLRKALKSRLFDCVVLPGAITEVKMLKALQLFARESNACVLFLSKVPKNAWAIPFQMHVNWEAAGKTYRVELLKSKFTAGES